MTIIAWIALALTAGFIAGELASPNRRHSRVGA